MQEYKNFPLYWFGFQVELNKNKNIKNLICKLDSQSTFRENIKRSIGFTGPKNFKYLDPHNPNIKNIRKDTPRILINSPSARLRAKPSSSGVPVNISTWDDFMPGV